MPARPIAPFLLPRLSRFGGGGRRPRDHHVSPRRNSQIGRHHQHHALRRPPGAGRGQCAGSGEPDRTGGNLCGWCAGTPQAVQYFAVNPARKISIFAITPSRLQDRKEITIAVQACPEVTTTLELLHNRNPYRRDHVDFHAVLRGPAQARAYLWQFGDGTTATTREPFVSHDYSAAMTQQDKFSYFNATVTVSGPGLVSARRIALGSSFAMSRSMGFVQADVRHTVTKSAQGLVVGYQIRNHHGTPITFTQYLKQYLPCDYQQPTAIQSVAAETCSARTPGSPIRAAGRRLAT